MPYLIDANNLAGKLGILREPDFDQRLVEIMRAYAESAGKKIILVFDSNDLLGDRYTEDNVTVIYTPRDAIYENADDKIIELMEQEKKPGDWIVISDDTKILDKADDLGIDSMLARDFARKLNPDIKIENEDELSESEESEITDELMDEWN
ncbi:MAG: NYN domain-containing protein [Patescibacteria group bacterium]|jgi:predicted RNA-binding protein with PIN domain